VPLSEITAAIKDGSHGTHRRYEEGVPLLSAKNVTERGKLEWGSEDSLITELEFRAITAAFAPQTEDLLLTIVGSLGRRCLFDGSKVAFQRSVAFVRPDRAKLSPDYLFHATGTQEYCNQLIRRSNATAQAGLYLGELAKTTIPLPPLDLQARICDVLKALDRALEATDALISKCQRIKTGLIRDLLTRGMNENGDLRPSREEAPQYYSLSPDLTDLLYQVDC
jgi:type I restriction enzyme S subunit